MFENEKEIMKILVVNWRCIKNPEAGGAEVHLHEIFRRVVKKGHDVTLVAHKFKGAPDKEVIDGIKVIRHGNRYLFDKQFKVFYKSNLSHNNFDLVVDDISKIPLETPTYVKKPLVGIIHHIHGKSLYKEIPAPMAYYIIRKEKEIPFIYDKTPVFAVSPSTRNELISMGANPFKIDFLYNAVDHDLFNRIKVEKFSHPTISYIGRVKKYKQIEKIIDVLPLLAIEFPDIEFRIGGRGDHIPELMQYVEDKNLTKYVTFLGFLSEEEKAEELGKAWLFVTMPAKEGWGITVIEANAMGTPVVGADVEGLRDSILDCETGFLVPPNEPEELAKKINKLLEDKNLRDNFSENARRWAQKFTWDNSAEHFLKKINEWFGL